MNIQNVMITNCWMVGNKKYFVKNVGLEISKKMERITRVVTKDPSKIEMEI